jgi:hypothetical protein
LEKVLTAILILSVACAIEAVIIAALAAAVPFLIWKWLKLEQKIDTLDIVVSDFCAAAGLPAAKEETKQ